MEYNVNISSDQVIDARHHRYGKPVRFDITLQAGNYLVYNDNGELELISYQDFLLPLTSVCSFRRSKNRSRTMDVTEQYLPNFWVIDIQGLCLNDFDRVSHRLAHEQKELLRLLTCGNVDDGKSTLIGRLLHDSKLIYEDHLDASAGMDIYGSALTTFDMQLSWQYDAQIRATLGGQNVFNALPDTNPFRGEVGALYPPTSPSGINGAFYYLGLEYTFQ